jgi:hypothetical protein
LLATVEVQSLAMFMSLPSSRGTAVEVSLPLVHSDAVPGSVPCARRAARLLVLAPLGEPAS